jgi:hypothetical protein
VTILLQAVTFGVVGAGVVLLAVWVTRRLVWRASGREAGRAILVAGGWGHAAVLGLGLLAFGPTDRTTGGLPVLAPTGTSLRDEAVPARVFTGEASVGAPLPEGIEPIGVSLRLKEKGNGASPSEDGATGGTDGSGRSGPDRDGPTRSPRPSPPSPSPSPEPSPSPTDEPSPDEPPPLP